MTQPKIEMQIKMQKEKEAKRVVVIGAGVSGLTTALLLSRSRERKYEILVMARYMPGDYDVEYCSPWAGADYMPTTCEKGSAEERYHRRTWLWFKGLAERMPEAGVHFELATVYTRKKDEETGKIKFPVDPWWKELFPDYRSLPKNELPEGIARAASFTTVCINTALYLTWLLSQCLKEGITFQRATLTHISSAFKSPPPGNHHSSRPSHIDLLLNCTGLGSLSLGGVHDKTMFPIRGQVAIVRNPLLTPDGKSSPAGFSISGTDDGENESCYGMTRAAGGGTVLGGCSQVGSWDGNVDLVLAGRILGRAGRVWPGLLDGEEGRDGDGNEGMWDVVRYGVGLRPAREGGVRVEREEVEISLGSVGGDGDGDRDEGKGWVVHNYGHAGEGYQMSVGCAEDAVELVEGIFRGK